jgi:hypothetical protein
MSLRRAALVAGFGYAVIFLGGLGFFLISNLRVAGDAAATASNITASESQLRIGVASVIIVLAADLVVAWALYVFLKPVNESLSLLAAWVRLVYVAVAASAMVNLLAVLQLLSGADHLAAQTGQLTAQAMLFLEQYDYGFNVGFVFFGLHILGLGYLIVRSDYIPRVLGVLLIIASVGYFIDSFASFFSSDYANNETLFVVFVAVPAIIAELSLTVWLFIRGGKRRPAGEPASESA